MRRPRWTQRFVATGHVARREQVGIRYTNVANFPDVLLEILRPCTRMGNYTSIRPTTSTTRECPMRVLNEVTRLARHVRDSRGALTQCFRVPTLATSVTGCSGWGWVGGW
eukprot:5196222-Prymnesium_polylepis.1